MSKTLSAKNVKLSLPEQLARAKTFYQAVDPQHWGQGEVPYRDYDKALRQRYRNEKKSRAKEQM